VSVSFDAGSAADPAAKLGVQALTMSLLDEGTTTKNSTQIAEAQERLGATISSAGGVDRSSVGLYALTPNLPASLDLLADVVRNPAFDAKEVERLRNQQAARIASQLTQPGEIARTILPAKIYGAAHPYGRPAAGLGDAATVTTFTRDDVVAFQQGWLQPSKAEIYVVGDTTMATLKPLLEARFGNWAEDKMARPQKDFSVAVPPAQGSRIFLIDRPGSPQSFIYAGQVTGGTGKDPALTVARQANDVLGGNFLSRMNTDLRETKGWSYGVGSGFTSRTDKVAFVIQAPVQTDQTGPSIAALLSNMRDYLGAKGTTPEELERTTNGSIRELPGSFETSDAVLGGLISIVQLGRADDYYETIAAKYRAMTAADFDKAARATLDPDKLAFVVVGDATKVRPQLDKLGLPIEVVQLPVAK
jgi:zinc protease